jgi:hypothetical protein
MVPPCQRREKRASSFFVVFGDRFAAPLCRGNIRSPFPLPLWGRMLAIRGAFCIRPSMASKNGSELTEVVAVS